jgi:alpha-tubulin suppressor-like RCC1 family protein
MDMISNQYEPTLVATLRGKKVVKAVSAAESVLILTADDKVYACGAFDTQMSSSQEVNHVYPTLLPVVDASHRVIDVQCGAYHYAAVLQSIPKVEAPQVEALLQTVPAPVPETLVIDSEEHKWTSEKPLNTKLLVWGAFPAANRRAYTHPVIFDAPATLTQIASGSAHVIYLDADHQVYATGRFDTSLYFINVCSIIFVINLLRKSFNCELNNCYWTY